MYKDSLSTIYPLQLCKLSLLAVDQCGNPAFKWEEGVKESAARLLQCHKWQLTAQIRSFWWQKLREAKSWLWAVVPWDGWMDTSIVLLVS